MTHELKRQLYSYFKDIPNPTETEKYLLQNLDGELNCFDITSLSRDDLENLCNHPEGISNGAMEMIAQKMDEAYINNGFWEDLSAIYEDFKNR